MNISFMNLTNEKELITYDYFWLSVKSYIEDNYEGNSSFVWNYPHKYPIANNVEEFAQNIINENPDVFFVSLYVWNYPLSKKVMKIVKRNLPNCIIVIGGPHLLYKKELDFFKKHPYIDYICESEGYGEVFANEFLYQLETDKNWDEVPYIIRPKEDGIGHIRPKKQFNKRNFEWSKKIFERNSDYLMSLRKEADAKTAKMYFHYESSRGCPFGCTYCEWGGGINSKVNFKPTEDIFDDLDFIFSNIKPEFFTFTDANFGIIERDVDIAKKICEYNDTIGYPEKINMYGPTKVRKENLYKIEEMFASRDLTTMLKIPVQDTNDIVNKNIDRTDDDWKTQMVEYGKIRDKHNVKIMLEMILGLPGATLDSYYEGHELTQEYRVDSLRYVWHFLPTAPAANKNYVEKFKIETMKLNQESLFNTTFEFKGILKKDEIISYNGEHNLNNDTRYVEPSEIVVSTYSYTREEWCEMWLMENFINVFESKGYLSNITKYLRRERGISIADFYRKLWKSFLNSDNFLNKKQNIVKNSIINETIKRVTSPNNVEDFYFYDLPEEFGLELRMQLLVMIVFMININRKDFYKGILNWMKETYGDDPILEDMVSWTNEMILWLDYDPKQGKDIISLYDWDSWLKGEELEKVNTKYSINDQYYLDGRKKIDWHEKNMKDRVLDRFFVMCSDCTSSTHLFKKWETVNVKN